MFAYKVLSSPHSALAAWDQNRNDSVGEASSGVVEEAAMNDDNTIMASTGEVDEASAGQVDGASAAEANDASVGEANETARPNASIRTGPTADSEKRASPPWNFDSVEQSLVVDENGKKRSTRANRPQPGSLKE